MKKAFIAIILSSSLVSCRSSFTYRDLSTYNIDSTSLLNNDTVKIIFCSGGPNDNSDKTYYYQLIAVKYNQPNDTVNILTPDISNLEIDDNIKIFISYNSDAYRLLSGNIDLGKVKDLESIKPPVIKRVITNNDYKTEQCNDYPTVIGILGESDLSRLPDDVKQHIDNVIH